MGRIKITDETGWKIVHSSSGDRNQLLCTELLNAQSTAHFGIYYFDEKLSQLAGDGVTPLTRSHVIVTGTINWC